MKNSPEDPRIQALRGWTEAGWLRLLDLHFARFLLDLDPEAPALLPLAAALLAHLEGAGHTCLAIEEFLEHPRRYLDWPQDGLDTLKQALTPWSAPETWALSLAQSRCVEVIDASSPSASEDRNETPLVLNGHRLYLRRYWRDEQFIARTLQVMVNTTHIDPPAPESLKPWLDQLFPEDPSAEPMLPWQKFATALALRSQFSIITGGPGTGKTYTAARLIALLMASSSDKALRIVLAAPTGKAAVRIDESLRNAVAQLPQLGTLTHLHEAFASLDPARTLHSLLGSQPGSRRFRHNAHHPLELDVLIIDEASMIHQEMMAALLRALPAHARLILLGDQDQLASVEAGAVLAELCSQSGHYDPATCDWLQASCGCAPQPAPEIASPLAAGIVRLQRSHRFNTQIGALADAVHLGHTDAALQCLRADNIIQWQEHPELQQILAVASSLQGYLPVWERLRRRREQNPQQHPSWVQSILEDYSHFRILCALRQGPWGVTGLNQAIENYLDQQGLRTTPGIWYAGRPTLITRNDPQLGLSNGDIGIALPNPEGKLRVYFPSVEGGVRAILPSRLNHCESAWAMTVHKAQGSEFRHTCLVLPPEDSPVLSRELLYTAITRARELFTLFATHQSLDNAICRRTQRMSGLQTAFCAEFKVSGYNHGR
ncbi:MAG: exodeoxyribonuclease V subunit alpha [Acidithiobacillus sp.]